jgi:hypothetical protein
MGAILSDFVPRPPSRLWFLDRRLSLCSLPVPKQTDGSLWNYLRRPELVRMPISKQRNKHIQQVLVEAAKLAPRFNHELTLVYEREPTERKQEQGNARRSQDDGRLHARRRAQKTGLSARRATWRRRGSAKTCPGIQNIRIFRCAGCQIPQMTRITRTSAPRPLREGNLSVVVPHATGLRLNRI